MSLQKGIPKLEIFPVELGEPKQIRSAKSEIRNEDTSRFGHLDFEF